MKCEQCSAEVPLLKCVQCLDAVCGECADHLMDPVTCHHCLTAEGWPDDQAADDPRRGQAAGLNKRYG